MKREIHLAGGCFWGLEEYLANLPGVLETEAGYANGRTGHPSYEQVCHEDTGHAETVRVVYDADKLGLAFLLERYFEVIDPTARNRQGGDAGRQYRTGIYYTDAEDQAIAQRALDALQQGYPKPVAIELMPLNNYCRAEEYHQRYLRKNPHGYCHIPQGRFEAAKSAHDPGKTYTRKTDEELSRILTPEQFAVTRKNATEPPFRGALTDEHRQGIYVDITTGEPLFASADKFDPGCGWPSFSRPLHGSSVAEKTDATHGMQRTEVRSGIGDAHLGHVFEDGPAESGGLRYCINSASLRFIPKQEMAQQGYGHLLHLVK